MEKTKKLTISLPDKTWETIKKEFGSLGNNESEKIQNIVISFLSCRNYFLNFNKLHDHTDINDNMEVLDDMITSTVGLLEDKNIISDKEWKERMAKEIMQ